MPLESTVPATVSTAAALDSASRRLLHRWDAHLAARGVLMPEREDFKSFGTLWQLEDLLRILNVDRPLAGC